MIKKLGQVDSEIWEKVLISLWSGIVGKKVENNYVISSQTYQING